VTDYTLPNAPSLASLRSLIPGELNPEPMALDATPKLTPRAGLIVALLSFGLWGAIWQAVSSLAATWLP
jgi:hypothetical protein